MGYAIIRTGTERRGPFDLDVVDAVARAVGGPRRAPLNPVGGCRWCWYLRPFDQVYSGMTEEERIRHANYVIANTTFKGPKPTAFMDPTQTEQYIQVQGALTAPDYPPEMVEELLRDLPPQAPVEQCIKVALRRISARG